MRGFVVLLLVTLVVMSAADEVTEKAKDVEFARTFASVLEEGGTVQGPAEDTEHVMEDALKLLETHEGESEPSFLQTGTEEGITSQYIQKFFFNGPGGASSHTAEGLAEQKAETATAGTSSTAQTSTSTSTSTSTGVDASVGTGTSGQPGMCCPCPPGYLPPGPVNAPPPPPPPPYPQFYPPWATRPIQGIPPYAPPSYHAGVPPIPPPGAITPLSPYSAHAEVAPRELAGTTSLLEEGARAQDPQLMQYFRQPGNFQPFAGQAPSLPTNLNAMPRALHPPALWKAQAGEAPNGPPVQFAGDPSSMGMQGPPMQGPPMQGPPMQGPPMQGPPMQQMPDFPPPPPPWMQGAPQYNAGFAAGFGSPQVPDQLFQQPQQQQPQQPPPPQQPQEQGLVTPQQQQQQQPPPQQQQQQQQPQQPQQQQAQGSPPMPDGEFPAGDSSLDGPGGDDGFVSPTGADAITELQLPEDKEDQEVAEALGLPQAEARSSLSRESSNSDI